MLTKFSEFFKLTNGKADDFQKRLYTVIKDATDSVDCYRLIYEYIIGGLKWRSRKYRHDEMDDTTDITGLKQQQMDDARDYFEGAELGDPLEIERARFEYLKRYELLPSTKYGRFVYSLKFNKQDVTTATRAYRQALLYSQVKIYNKEYAKQVTYQEDHIDLEPPKNGLIEIDPASKKGRINPDSQDQKNQLIKFVNDLVTWVKENYPDVKAVLAVTNKSELFELLFTSGKLSAKEINDALQTMLSNISGVAKDPDDIKTAFRQWVIKELEKDQTFWKNEKISAAFASIENLKTKNDNPKTYRFFRLLFSNFLSPNPHEGESEAEAKARRTKALNYISTIFSTFDNAEAKKKYDSLMETAREMIQAYYPGIYIDNLLRAEKVIPDDDDVNTTLGKPLANMLKDLADELLGTLPLSLGGTEVRFSTIENFSELKALNKKGISFKKSDERRSNADVKYDPREYKNLNDFLKVDRLIYRSFKINNTSKDKAIAFCNLPLPLYKGTFYYRHLENPSLIKVKDPKFFNGVELTIDFLNYTIAYKGKPCDPTKNDNNEAYRSGGGTILFFADLQKKTKWMDLKGGKRYDPYYQTNPNDAKSPFPHLAAYMAAGRGVSRVLPLRDDNLCVWVWNYRDNVDNAAYDKLGEVLELPMNRQINPAGLLKQLENLNPLSTTVQVGGAQYKFVNYGNKQLKTDGFYYSMIGLTRIQPPGEEQFYVRVNTPSPGVAAVLTAGNTKGRSRLLSNDPKQILEVFDFSYYRRITNTTDDKTQQPPFREDFKVIQLFEKGNIKYMRSVLDAQRLEWPDDKLVAIGVNLPICFNLEENVIQYFKDKGGRGKIINKGNTLFRERKPRQDAATAMRPILEQLKPPMSANLAGTKVPATAFANGGMGQSTAVENDWGLLKTARGNYLPINQEWCHLRGHSDGGDEYPGNFVSGSFHCNTEQLAIESGQRYVTHQMPENSFKLHTTAYLLRDAPDYKSGVDDQRNSQILNGNYLTPNQTAYQQMVDNNNARRANEQGTGGNSSPVKKPKTDASPAPEQGKVAPLAAYLRYKVMRCKKEANQSKGKKKREEETLGKSFDFIFEGQGEFLDKNQFTITDRAVHFALAGVEAFKMWYKSEKDDLASNTTKKLQQTEK
jgi:hypothetical protein